MRVARCNAEGCRAAILWVRTINGGRAPLDAEPVGRDVGNLVLVKATEGEDPIALHLTHLDTAAVGSLEREGAAFYVDHHATCPNVEDFRNHPL